MLAQLEMSSRWRPHAALLLSALFVLSVATIATARVEAASEYSKSQTFSGALRYVRLDLGYEVVERDAEAAYLIFRYAAPGQAKATSTGTVEIVESDGKVRFFVQLPRMPEYHERILRDGLLKKLRAEYGAPARKKDPEKKPETKPDAGSEPGSQPSENQPSDSR